MYLFSIFVYISEAVAVLELTFRHQTRSRTRHKVGMIYHALSVSCIAVFVSLMIMFKD